MEAVRSCYRICLLILLIQTDANTCLKDETGNNTSTVCRLRVNKSSRIFFQEFVQHNGYNHIHVQMRFMNTTNVKYKYELIQPIEWLWSKRYDVVDYLKWPYEFPIMSLSLLHTNVPKQIMVFFETEPKNCEVYLGTNATIQALEVAIANLTKDVVKSLKTPSFAFTRWCYKELQNGFNTSSLYKAAVYIGWYIPVGKWRCILTSYDWKTKGVSANYSATEVGQFSLSIIVPTLTSLIIFMYLPLCLTFIEPRRKSHQTSATSDTGPFEGRKQRDSVSTEIISVLSADPTESDTAEETPEGFIYLNGSVPVSMSTFFFDIFGLAKHHPLLASRIRRSFCLLLCPCLIYLNILLHCILDPEYTKQTLVHNGPMGFLTILREDRGRHLFVPYIGGPIGAFIVFHVFGFVLLITPSDLGKAFIWSVSESHTREYSPLFISFKTIQEISCCRQSNNSSLSVGIRLLAQFFMIWRPYTWLHFFKIQYERFMSIYRISDNSSINSKLAQIGLLLITPLYICLCFIELLLCVVFYGLPVISLAILTIITLFRYLRHKFGLKLLPLDVCFVVCIVSMVLLFGLTASLIIIHSLSFVSNILLFTLLAVIIFPADAFGYAFFGTAILYYMYTLMSRVGQEYNTLLVHVVDICFNLQQKPWRYIVTNGTLKLDFIKTFDIVIDRVNIDNIEVELSEQIREHFKALVPRESSIRSNYRPLVHDTGLYRGIPIHLFDIVVRLHKPLYIHVFEAALRICMIIFLLFITFEITNSSGTSGDLSGVMHVVFIVVMGTLPHVIDMPNSDSTLRVREGVRLKQIENTIINYVTKNEHMQDDRSRQNNDVFAVLTTPSIKYSGILRV